VEVWVQAQQQLGIQTDIPAAAVAICCGSNWVSSRDTTQLLLAHDIHSLTHQQVFACMLRLSTAMLELKFRQLMDMICAVATVLPACCCACRTTSRYLQIKPQQSLLASCILSSRLPAEAFAVLPIRCFSCRKTSSYLQIEHLPCCSWP
jgi:hypothetical protein